MIGYLEFSCKTNLTPGCFSSELIFKEIKLVMSQMSHVKGLLLLHCLDINLIFDLFFLIFQVTISEKSYKNRHKCVKEVQQNRKVLKILFTALKVYLHFRQLR